MAASPPNTALDLAKCFRRLSVSLGDYRFSHWSKLTDDERQKLEAAEWDILGIAMDFTTVAVDEILSSAHVKQLQDVVEKAKKAVDTLDDARRSVALAAACVGVAASLLAAILTRDASAIGKAIEGLEKALKPS